MTLGEIKGFLKAIAKRTTEQRMAFISGVTVGAQGSKKAIKDTIKELEKALKSLEDD